MSFHVPAGDDGHVHVVIGPEGNRLEFDVWSGARDGWFRGAEFSVTLRSSRDGINVGREPVVRRLRRRFLAFERSGVPSPWPQLKRALEEARRFHGVRDSMYREVSENEAILRLGFRCNQKCEFCWQNRGWPDPPNELYPVWLDEIADAGVDTVTLSGGEPTIHRQFLPLVERARERGLDVAIQTNAVQLAKPGFAERLAELGIGRLFISFHSHRAEVSDAMTSAPRTHERTRQGIARALEAGLAVSLNCVVERRNFGHLAEHARAIIDWYVTPFADNPVRHVEYSHPCAYYREELWADASVPLDEVRPHLIAAIRVLHDAGVPVHGIGTCGFPPCMLQGTDLPIRVMDRDSQTEGDVRGRVYASVCEPCVFRSNCLGLRREYLDVHGERGVSPFTEMPEHVVSERDAAQAASDSSSRP